MFQIEEIYSISDVRRVMLVQDAFIPYAMGIYSNVKYLEGIRPDLIWAEACRISCGLPHRHFSRGYTETP